MDVAIVGGGIIGCCAAALLAEAGADVVLVEREKIGAGASGRNSGVLQHPLDARLADLHFVSLAMHREVLDLRDEPDGILIVGATSIDGLPSEVEPELLDDAAMAEPLLRAGNPGVLLNTGWVIGPIAATQAWWRRAEAAGARLVAGDGPPPQAERVLLATGAWTAGVTPLWGVTARVRLRFAARHVLEQGGVQDIAAGADGEFFTLVGDVLGSSFSAAEPNAKEVGRRLREGAKRFIGDVDVTSAKACPRPQSPDGLPMVGQVDDRTWVCSGHGPWGISIGPATARMVVGAMQGARRLPEAFDPLR